MFSHTVPKRLLEEFAYFDPVTRSKRLWRYEQGRTPYPRVSPRKATGIEGHFADPQDRTKEQNLESKLAAQFESPVNEFLFKLTKEDLVAGTEKRRQLTFYVTLLFNRSEARRKASKHMQSVTRHAYELFCNNPSQVATVAAKWSIEQLLSGTMKHGLITSTEVIRLARKTLANRLDEGAAQESYLRTVVRAMSDMDETLYEGNWNCLYAKDDNPFILSDAPVTTWERLDNGNFSFGLGFHRENVEVALPISPTQCLHILPRVNRTHPASIPSVEEINRAQAAFAGRACYSNLKSEAIQRLVQENFGKAELGVKGFTVWHRDYRNAVFDILMGQTDWIERTRRRT